MSESKDIYTSAVAMLSRREHSREELRQKLARKLPSLRDEIEIQLDRLEEQGYQSDERFTEAYMRMRMKRGFGLVRIRQELAQKGISSEILERVFVQDEAELARQSQTLIFEVWQKRFGSLPDNYRDRAKQQGYLRYRGFSSDEITQLFRELDSSQH